MFVSESLVFTELHKTAGSHLLKLLSTYVGGEQIGKHNRIPVDLRKNFVLGSIRNPWDWYVSLWGYGCDKRGSVYLQTSRKINTSYCWRQLPKEMGYKRSAPGPFIRQMKHDLGKDPDVWNPLYTDSSDVAAFRKWIKLMFDPAHALDVGEGYGFSPLSQHAGILSYRFFKLFTGLDANIYNDKIDMSQASLPDLWKNFSFVDAFVRQEQLEEDFIQALEKAGIQLSDDDKSAIRAGKNNKTNTSSRKSVSHYYDEETATLIQNREQFIVDRFGYDINEVLR